ncbi:MAG: hypothetical protein U1F39_12400 [Steroidobacteraceae bacterium]
MTAARRAKMQALGAYRGDRMLFLDLVTGRGKKKWRKQVTKIVARLRASLEGSVRLWRGQPAATAACTPP